MKTLKRLALIVFILIAIGIIFRGWLYRSLVTYKSLGERTNYVAHSRELIGFLEANSDESQLDYKSVIQESLKLTSKSLHFTEAKNEVDPNKLISTRSAHCIGYAAFFSTICNLMFEKSNLSNEWTASPHIGQLYFMGKNIHTNFKSSFFKDHDFVVIENKSTGEKFGVDPSLHDYTGIQNIMMKK